MSRWAADMATHKVGDMTVRISADTRPFNRALRQIGRKFWWMHYGPTVTAVGLIVGFAAGFLVGMVR